MGTNIDKKISCVFISNKSSCSLLQDVATARVLVLLISLISYSLEKEAYEKSKILSRVPSVFSVPF